MATVLSDASAASAPRVRRSPLWWPVVAVPAAAAVVYTVLTRRPTGDIRYVLAALRTGGEAGYSPSEVFTHRPFFYRWFIALLDDITFGGVVVRETVMYAAGTLLAAAAAYALYQALLRRLTGREAALTAGATGLLMILTPRTDFLQPEWAAVVLAVFGVAAALGVARPWPAALISALPFGLAVMMKYSTASTAAFGILLVYVVDRGRAIRVTLVSVVGALVLFALSVLAGSHEWQWTHDMPLINQSALSRTGIHPAHLFAQSVDFLADRSVLSPVLLLLPGALLLLLARVSGRGRRVELLVVALAIGCGSLAVVIVQGNWFMYHAFQLTVVAAAMWGLAVGGARRSIPRCFGVVSLLFGLLPVLYAQAPKGVQRPATIWALGLVALLAAAVDAWRESRGADRVSRGVLPAAIAALAGVVCLSGSVWPGSPHLVAHGKVGSTNASFLRGVERKQDHDRELRAQIPDGARVLYLAFGDDVYFIDHPAQCRYPISTFLQRSRFLPDVADLKSFKENADCVDHNPAPYAVLDRVWFKPGKVDPELRRRISATYDCPPANGDLKIVVCKRRSGTS
ncbi:hypothetical protein PV336_20755 [Streptomyces sp. MI02-2A]|uniref:hypothetical protein n=1 Tax=unclassified Streptomyces TaxID=2593676 RepID=UPI000740F206|nr:MULTISPECIES: hypothetical protein [unclassified Streptomyces]KUJ41489.1 hypothetical protein ADL25_16500 [Streptomyces sp. NRRL F-5122]MDX3261641.1 hypothetical protein [Streptomyces sp. MI02-2A]